MNKWTIGGVPEHFNVPWQDLIRAQASDRIGATPGSPEHRRVLRWREFPGGTGAMIDAMAAGELELAILLTEGAVAGLQRGVDFKIVSNYVASPLIWGIHVAPGSGFATREALAPARFAVSRFGSGSHLMALALANSAGWQLDDEQFVVVGSLDGAIQAFAEGRADVFLWEHFMTQPVVDRGLFVRIGDFVAPWSAFVTCARQDIWRHNQSEVEALVRAAADEATRFAQNSHTPQRLSETFGLSIELVGEWLSKTRWASGIEPPNDDLTAAREMLRIAGLTRG